MTKKQSITLELIYNDIQQMYAHIMNTLEDLRRGGPIQKPEETLLGTDILDTEYVTITADDVTVGGESTRQYHGEDIYNYYFLTAYFKEARDIIRKEYGYELLEIHCLQSSTDGEYAKPGNPVPNKDGTYAWCRCVWKNKAGAKVASPSWVFYRGDGSASGCADGCAYNCANFVQFNSGFRSAVFGSLGA